MMDDIINKQFGKLTVKNLELVVNKPARNKADYTKSYYYCECECGGTKIVEKGNLTSDHTLSCGCLKKRKAKDNKCWKGFGDISGKFWSQIKKHALNRRLAFNITIEDAWTQFQKQDGKCALTSWKINFGKNKTASLDRINNSLGYEINNIQWLHKDVNWMKGRFSTDRFIEICKAVANKENLCF